MSSDNVTQTDSVAASVPAPEPSAPPPAAARPRHTRRKVLLGALVALAVLMPVLAGGLWVRVHSAPSKLVVIHRATPGGSFPWSNDARTTAPSAQYAVFAQQNNPVDPAFQAYYTRVHGATLLGNALTPAYLTQLGWLQIFANGALIAPAQSNPGSSGVSGTPGPTATLAPSDLDPSLLHNGKFDGATGIVRLPLLDVLLTVGSTVPVGGDDSALTYIALRDATAPNHLAHLPVWRPVQSTSTASGVFIAESSSKGIASGHIIPLTVWSYITQSGVAPDGWQDTFGNPLTEAIATTSTVNGVSHRLLVQAFALATVVIDLDNDDDQGQPIGSVVPLGRDYLETLGPPPVIVPAGGNVWLTGDTAVVTTPGGSSASAHLGLNFPLALSGKTQWINGALWYEATWKSPHRSGSGWTSAHTVTITPPAKGAAAWASFDALSPDIASYLASFGTNVGSVVYDITRNRYYTYNQNMPFVLASSSKVSIMVAYLSWVESQGRAPNAFENSELTNMIEHSDNNAAQLLFDRLGDGPGMAAFYQRIGVAGYVQNPYGWGWSSLPPIGQVKVLTMLQQGAILNAQNRSYALYLMTHIEADQRMGVGETLPPGATVAMKDGWVPAPDGLWAINTSGIVTDGNETYIIVVYTAHQYSYDGGWNITRRVCKTVGPLLV